MQETLFYVGIVCGVLAVAFLVTTVAMFVGYRIPELWKNMSGSMEQKYVEEIRLKNSSDAQQKGKINVFEELEKKAKVKKPNTYSLNVSTTTTGFAKDIAMREDAGTSVLQSPSKAVNPDFIIEKDLMFVSTNEVI